ncbi:MAG: hypothetical protein AB7E76_09930 [Deferribacterales bacterium]
MSVYNITYDLNRTGQDYNNVINTIKSHYNWCHYQKSAFLVETRETAEQIYRRLAPFFDKNDRLLIINVCGYKAGWLDKEVNDWIMKYVPACK